ncbi:succinate dehydrogenase assembly factor 4 [Dongia mobilis]|uniref:succinate dehydrogenase assembly factor 4 n=1 Tax=Dongia sp. TaxID=1977262 RepID=UPI0026EE9B75
MKSADEKLPETQAVPATKPDAAPKAAPLPPKEFGGPTGPEPTRYGDWERNGRVSDF